MGDRRGLRALSVRRIVRESVDVVSLELADPSGAPLPAWEPGAHIDLQLVTRQQRQYSLCGDPADRFSYRVAVLREELSRGASSYVHSYLREGSTVHVGAPRNHFALQPASSHLLLAAGIGITAILPMALELERRGEPFSLHYAVRDAEHLPFRRELAALEARGADVTVHSPERAGRLDVEQLLREPREGVAVACCGPARFVEAVEAAMRAWPEGSLQLERFEPRARSAARDAAAAAPFSVIGARSSVRIQVGEEETALRALNAHGLAPVASCRRGVCGSCALTVLAGEPDHRDSLTTDESSTTWYPCVSRSRSPELVVDL
ncbi:2Fe-2S iron-sulfur cluster-binding protein [Herbiconiux sp. P15]|uniref:PDR/VanB family oxidoreductase n=1 Tax=Herbiconiux liukaitaii TaxID=3342799 RepID=UPI0035BB30F9